VELGRRLFYHLFRLPLSYFETRPTGQTVARIRELETIRNFLTGQGLTSLLDLVFTLLFIVVLFLYSMPLTLVVLVSIPIYVILAMLIRPLLRDGINEKFNRGARSQQFLVESIIGVQTLKAASVEPLLQVQWEERLASYVETVGAQVLQHPLEQAQHHHGGQLRDFVLGEEVDLHVEFRPAVGRRRRPVLTDQYEGRQENPFDRRHRRQDHERLVECRDERHPFEVDPHPQQYDHNMQVHEDHAAGEAGDTLGHSGFRASG